MKDLRRRVVVVGSLNIDYIASVDRLPHPGETVLGNQLVQRFGGKGANQAIAAARQGARVAMIGCLGSDDHGSAYIQRMRREGIDTSGICRSKRDLTGTALIAVDASAENLIIVAPAANGSLKPHHVRAHRSMIEEANMLLLQFEVPMPAVLKAVRIANAANVPVVLNPSPLRSDFPWGVCTIDALIVNQGEAQRIFGLGPREAPAAWSVQMQRRKINCLIITRGARATLGFCRASSGDSFALEVSTLPVTPIDTVGAGDAFAGAFAACAARNPKALASRGELQEAIVYASCAGALSTLKPGAQESIPNRAATERAARKLVGVNIKRPSPPRHALP